MGDDAQSIYSFQAATIRNIHDFPNEFSPRPADVVTLDRNYRSTEPIVAAANSVIDLARERFTKNLWIERVSEQRPLPVSVRDEADQAAYVVEQVLANRELGVALKHQAVLFHSSSHSGSLEAELIHRNVPFVKFGGLKFLDSAHVKDLLAVLRLAQNPGDRFPPAADAPGRRLASRWQDPRHHGRRCGTSHEPGGNPAPAQER